MNRGAVALSLVLAGCVTTTADLRERPPKRTAAVTGEYRRLAACLMEGLEGDPATAHAVYRVLDRTDERRASVLATQQIGFAASAIFEARFAQTGPTVAIETRTAVPRVGNYIDARAWPIIEACAAKS